MAMDPQKKDDIFRNPEMDNLHFGRVISVVSADDKSYSAMQLGKGRCTRVLVVISTPDGQKHFISGPEGIVHQPCLCVCDGQVYVVWNETADDHWQIRCGRLDERQNCIAEIEMVFDSSGVCLPPTAATYDGKVYVAFSSRRTDDVLDIHVACKNKGIWQVETPFKNSRIDRFRPQLAAHPDGLYLAWDQYRQKRYEVVLASMTDQAWNTLEILGQTHERWLTPKVIADNKGTAYLCWVALRAVVDKLGIIDHHPYVMAAKYEKERLSYLKDKANPENPFIIGDLREGLLAGEIYKGHVGLRRNPQLALDQRNTLHLFWEMRKETKGSDVYGHLVGRKWIAKDQWSDPSIYSSSGYSYAIAKATNTDKLPLSYYFFETKDTDVFRSEMLDLQHKQELAIDGSKWNRWKYVTLKPQRKPSETVRLKDGEYYLVWADTHCHSNFSADAEGEPDELVHFARDTAGLDVITLIDNDYYPHKALTEAEWRIHGEMAEHFTRNGKFVWLPGYEFTYHRTDLNPDFNHRCVIYPRKGGKLLRRIDPDSNTDARMIAELTKTNGMAYPHHCSYELIDEAVEWNIEACSSWRVCLEETVCTWEKLNDGAKIGFIGSSDTHRMIPGLAGARTGLYVKELTPEGLFDAYRNRRLIATQGFNIFIDFKVNESFIGQETTTSRPPRITATIRAFEQIDYVEVIRDGVSIWWDSVGQKEFAVDFTDATVSAGRHFYVLKVKLIGDPSLNVDSIPAHNFPKPFEQNSRYPHNLARGKGVFAWTSPVWISFMTYDLMP